MRDYYARYFREVVRDLLRFWKEQVFVSLAAGVGTAFIGHALAAVSDNLVWKSAGAGVICYVGILLVRGWWASVKAPVILDRQRQAEFTELRDSKAKEVVKLNEAHASEIATWAKGATEMNADLAACREQLARKHPSDEVKDKYVRECLAKFDGMSTALKWLIHSGESHQLDIPAGYQHAITQATVQTSPKLVIANQAMGVHNRRPGRPDLVYSVNPEYKQSLADVLFIT